VTALPVPATSSGTSYSDRYKRILSKSQATCTWIATLSRTAQAYVQKLSSYTVLGIGSSFTVRTQQLEHGAIRVVSQIGRLQALHGESASRGQLTRNGATGNSKMLGRLTRYVGMSSGGMAFVVWHAFLTREQ